VGASGPCWRLVWGFENHVEWSSAWRQLFALSPRTASISRRRGRFPRRFFDSVPARRVREQAVGCFLFDPYSLAWIWLRG